MSENCMCIYCQCTNHPEPRRTRECRGALACIKDQCSCCSPHLMTTSRDADINKLMTRYAPARYSEIAKVARLAREARDERDALQAQVLSPGDKALLIEALNDWLHEFGYKPESHEIARIYRELGGTGAAGQD